MKKILIIAVFLCCVIGSYAQDICPVIPLPNKYEKKAGHFVLSNKTTIVALDQGIKPVAHYLQTELLRLFDLAVSSTPGDKPGSGDANPEILLMYSKDLQRASSAYRVDVSAHKIVLSGADNEGLFNGVISLLQLIPQSKKEQREWMVDCWRIQDQPVYSWRGLMLDESRHFFGKEVVKQILNWMAYYKLNRFHWHLTDQPGWRIEIKQYPKLAMIGGIGNYTNALAPARYYTQEEIKEIVAYAAERFIVVIPEIDMPGHATAANRAYPEFSGGGSAKFPDFTFNPGKEGTYQYLTNIIRETDALFPSQMIHIGGDEVHFGNEKWSADAEVAQLMKNKGLKDLKAVENYFFQRMADSVLKTGNKVLAWDEVAESDLPSDKTVVFWWRHDKPEQLQKSLDKGFSVVLCPRLPMYFDYQQDSMQVHGPDWRKFGLNSTENVYRFEQSGLKVQFPKKNLVLGIQANIWTERIVTRQKLEYMMYPRIAALAESAWTKAENKDYKDFSERLKPHLERYKRHGIYYFDVFSRKMTGEPVQ